MPPTPKMKEGAYAPGTRPQLQGQGSNRSQRDLDNMRLDGANQGAALRQVIPAGNQSYEDFQRTRKSPQGQAEKEAYERANKLPRLTDADYQQRRFTEGAQQLKQRASALPGSSVFDGAPRDAAYASQRDAALRLGNYADTNGAAATGASLVDRSARLPTQAAYAAPGMATTPTHQDFGDSTPMKKKMNLGPGPQIAKYPGGTKKVQAKARPSLSLSPLPDKPLTSFMASEDRPYKEWSTEGLSLGAAEQAGQAYNAKHDARILYPAASEKWQDSTARVHYGRKMQLATQMQEELGVRSRPKLTKPLGKPNPEVPLLKKYSDGASSIKAKQVDKLTSVPGPRAASNDPLSPGFMGPPTRGNSDAGLDEAAAEADAAYVKPSTALAAQAAPRKMSLGPKTYEQAAKVLQSNPALMAKYHAGVASGKAFSLNIGGKTFSYAATAKPGASKTPAAKPAKGASTANKQAPSEKGWHDVYDADIAAAKKEGKTPVRNSIGDAGPQTSPKVSAPPSSPLEMTNGELTDAYSKASPSQQEYLARIRAQREGEVGSTERNYAQYPGVERRSPKGELSKQDTQNPAIQHYPNGRMKGADGKMARANDLPTSATIRKMKLPKKG